MSTFVPVGANLAQYVSKLDIPVKQQVSTLHGYQIWSQSGSDWPQMGHIREIFRSDSVHFGAVRQNVLNLI